MNKKTKLVETKNNKKTSVVNGVDNSGQKKRFRYLLNSATIINFAWD